MMNPKHTNMSNPLSPRQNELLRKILASGRRLKLAAEELDIDVAGFLAQYYALSDEHDLEQDASVHARAALDHLRWARVRRANAAKVRVFNPRVERDGWSSKRTVVQTVTDDMPFLVDSLTMKLNTATRGIHSTFHPVLDVTRNGSGRLIELGVGHEGGRPESFMHIEIARETQSQALLKIEQEVKDTLADVRAAVQDWRAMLAKLREAAAEIGANKKLAVTVRSEAQAFLEWLAGDHFTLLGYREFDLARGDKIDRLEPRADTGLGISRIGPVRAMRLTGHARKEARSKDPLILTKANRLSSVHRPVPLDYIGVKVFDASGKPCAERRFLGLYTSVAYNQSSRDIPLLRLKVQQVMGQSGLDPVSHSGKALQHILDTFPRDDLIQGSLADLTRMSLGILGLGERHRLSLFCRKDAFDRFYSCLVYLPRDQYNYAARQRVEAILLDAFHGTSLRSRVTLTDSALARIEVTIKCAASRKREPDTERLRAELEAAVRSWGDRLREAATAALPEERALELCDELAEHFPGAYREAVNVGRAVEDMQKIALLREASARLQMSLRGGGGRLHLTTFQLAEPIRLYLAHPILEQMGLKVVSEDNYCVDVDPEPVWVQDFDLETSAATCIDASSIEARFHDCFVKTLHGEVENDGFNALVVTAGLDWRDVTLLRAYCKHILQMSNRFSQAYMQQVLGNYPALCRALLELFRGLFDPDLSAAKRKRLRQDADATLRSELDRAVSLDDDRILRGFTAAVKATLRTNFYQLRDGTPKSYLSLKLDPKQIPDLPRPRPMFEIFVYSPRVEGVHLRCGTIARGGLRWSDRREDFRTEILGLMKAQQVKNTVIVPTGAKGGFVCKALPVGDRSAVQAEVIDCYRTFIRGMLDITDNVVGDRVIIPDRVVNHDEVDPYLVVAADKGTAAFSDIANELAAEYGLWLGDAFASGGSAGYDHKKMGITARGAWQAVKRHFRELGIDTQNQEFTAIGIGDMSGDVFGNGMLLSRHTRLIAAFNHQHIFIDPDPDAAASYAERERLFNLSRSSWDDYDRSVLSAGGGIFSRDSKSIPLDASARAALGIAAEALPPPELIRAILKAKVDLLWNGGIGTYVKASSESHGDAGDPINDGVRIDARELGCRVVAEGGNLGLTQLGRVEFATLGGHINTDFIDNSGGVDSSDREVNIKILLNGAIENRKLQRGRRNALLADMTDEIAELVLANNYAQTLALSIMTSRAHERLGEHARLIRVLEARGLLDRDLEFLPGEEDLEERKAQGRGLTRPELAVILSYSKIELAASLVETDIPDDPVCAAELEVYFPRALVKRFKRLIYEHRLRREIVAMLIASSMVNRMGPFFVLRAEEETGTSEAQIARAYAIVREVFETRQLWQAIEALDNAVQAEVQYDVMFQISRMVRRAVYWCLQRHQQSLAIEATVGRLKPGIAGLLGNLPEVLGNRAAKRLGNDAREFESLGLPSKLALRIAALNYMTQSLDIVEIAGRRNRDLHSVARLYFEIGRGLRLDWIREQIELLQVEGRWRAMARASLREALADAQRKLVQSVLDHAPADSSTAFAAWLDRSKTQVAHAQRALDDMRSTGSLDFATLSVALKEIGRLV